LRKSAIAIANSYKFVWQNRLEREQMDLSKNDLAERESLNDAQMLAIVGFSHRRDRAWRSHWGRGSDLQFSGSVCQN
jgi:hypothetical protein